VRRGDDGAGLIDNRASDGSGELLGGGEGSQEKKEEGGEGEMGAAHTRMIFHSIYASSMAREIDCLQYIRMDFLVEKR
jgi:hypothetical protein